MKNTNPKDKLIFLLQLNERAKKEESPYAKLLFQENILSIFLVATLRVIELHLNKQNTRSILTNERKFKIEHLLKISFESWKIEEKTLGQLYYMVKPFLDGNENLKSSLKKFIDMRNKITHNMFSKYENMKQLENDSEKIIKIGEEAIKKLNIFRDKILEE